MESDYDRKFEEMKKYIPFLESMIRRLESTGSTSSNPRQAQLDKIRSLRDLLLDKKKRMKMENLLKCEQVLINLYAKVEQRDNISGVNVNNICTDTPKSQDLADLETVRNKLKSVSKRQDITETLPEIARASEIEEVCTPGSKEPALFQRRPNKSSLSPTKSSVTHETVPKSPLKSQSRRNYTRVLVSPEPRNWSPNESMSDKPLFSRRSPRRSPRRYSPSYKRERKKSSKQESQSRKAKDLNITLNVPEESLNSLNTKDILSRIINCSDSDVDIDTLRELRTQILGELKQTGAKDDISDLILKSYKNKKSRTPSGKMKKEDVEEGEISDSESEAIESIYGSLLVVEKEKNASNKVKTQTENDANHARKIQICLVINSDKEAISGNKVNESGKIDVSDFQMYDDGNGIEKKLITSMDPKDSSREVLKETNKFIEEKNDQSQEVVFIDKKLQDVNAVGYPKNNVGTEINTLNLYTQSKDPSKQADETEQETIQYKANFYKPIKEQGNRNVEKSHLENPESIEKADNEIFLRQCNKDGSYQQNIKSEEKHVDITVLTESNTKDVPAESLSVTADTNVIANVSDIAEKLENDMEIPLLNEPTVPAKPAETDVLSEIDILQALKNEILSETITLPGSETGTPALHQPKLTKVASAQEILPKKRISIEKYKLKSVPSSKQSLFMKEQNNLPKDDYTKKQSLKLTEKECERFNLSKSALDSNDSSDNEEKNKSYSLDDIYADLAPKSPDHEPSEVAKKSPVIIPGDSVQFTVVSCQSDIDMRNQLPMCSPNAIIAAVPSSHKITLSSSSMNIAKSQATSNSQLKVEQNQSSSDKNRVQLMDPRVKRDINMSVKKDSPNPHSSSTDIISILPNNINPNLTPTITPSYSPSITPSYSPSMTPSYNPIMTPSYNPSMTPTYSHSMTPSYNSSMTPIITPNARTYEMTPTHQSFEIDGPSNQKHVYAPTFPMIELREGREQSVPKEAPIRNQWEKADAITESRRSVWDDSDVSQIRKWDNRNPRSNSIQRDVGPHNAQNSDSYKYQKNTKSYNRSDCPRTPIPSFGWSDVPTTPTDIFSTTPVHSFGRAECPLTPSHPFGKSDNSHKFYKDPRLNRLNKTDYDSSSQYDESDRRFHHDRCYIRGSSYKPPNKSYNKLDSFRNFEREQSVGRNDTNTYYSSEPSRIHFRREHSVSRPFSKDSEGERFFERDCRSGRYREKNSTRYEEVGVRRNYQRERSVGRSMPEEFRRSSRASSVNRNSGKLETLSVKPHAGRAFTINTSVNTTFQDLIESGKGIQVFDYSFDARRQRAASVGRSLGRENSVGRTLPEKNEITNSDNKISRFKRASSVGRELTVAKDSKSFEEIKADFEHYRTTMNSKKSETVTKNSDKILSDKLDKLAQKSRGYVSPRGRKNDYTSQLAVKPNKNTDQPYSPRKNHRDPRMRREQREIKNKNTYHERRRDSRDNRNYGIVYSSDNIAKGILGSGYGVKNYKIPKLKRPPQDMEEVESGDKVKISDITENADQNGSMRKKTDIVSVKRSNASKIEKKDKESKIDKDANSDKTLSVKINKKEVIDVSPKRVTRSSKKNYEIETKQFKEDGKTRKYRKPVIYDSDSDKEENDKDNPPITKCTSKVSDHVIVDCKISQENQETLDSSFGLEDSEIFSDNIVSDPVIENINALIADLDHDLDTSKNEVNSNFSTDKNLDKMFETINSPETNSVQDLIDDTLGDISEVIEKDLFKNNVNSRGFTASFNTQKHDSKDSSDLNKIEIPKQQQSDDPDTKGEGTESASKNQSDFVTKTTNNPVLSPVKINEVIKPPVNNEAIVSTTDIGKGTNLIQDKIKICEHVDDRSNDGHHFPDSTINKNNEVVDQPSQESVPDSTYGAQNEINSDVTSTHEVVESPNKNIVESSLSQNVVPALNSIGSLLSILKDKSKIKELLTMLGDQSTENEKIKKKLEKLSEIVLDEEDSNVILNNDIERHENSTFLSDSDENNQTIDITRKSEGESEVKEKVTNETERELEPAEKNVSDSKILESQLVAMDQTKVEAEEKLLEKQNGKVDFPSESDSQLAKKNPTMDEEVKTHPIRNVPSKKFTIVDSKEVNESKQILEKRDLTNLEKSANGNDEDTEEQDYKESQEQEIVQNHLKNDKNMPLKRPRIMKRGKGGRIAKKATNFKEKRLTRAGAASMLSEKPAIVKKPSREVLKLQEDLKEMFLSEDILNDTGIRMCRLAKLVDEKNVTKKDELLLQEAGPVVVLEKCKDAELEDITEKNNRKKPGPKSKSKVLVKNTSADSEIKKDTPISIPKYKPGPKSKTKLAHKQNDSDPYAFETDSVGETSRMKQSEAEDNTSDSDSDSLSSSRSFGSSDVLADFKKKPKRKRRGWQAGVIKPKHKKKKDKQSNSLIEDEMIIPCKPAVIPDLNCFTDKTYCFRKNMFTYSCRFCEYSGTDIVHHYKKEHPHSEIPLSRMSPSTAKEAIEQCEQINFQAITKITTDKYVCRFCFKEFSKTKAVLEKFFWHIVSMHTGEYKQVCSECVNVTRCPFHLDIPPPPKDVKGQLIGYICGKCNYTQISLENLKTHVIVRHNDEQTEVYTINLAVMTKKIMANLSRRYLFTEAPRVLRSSRSNQSVTEISDDRSDVTESSDRASETESVLSRPLLHAKNTSVTKTSPIQSKIAFENDENTIEDSNILNIERGGESCVKIEQVHEVKDQEQTSQPVLFNTEHNIDNSNEDMYSNEREEDQVKGVSDDIMDYPHFKIHYTEAGNKEYVCCINANDNHYKTSLLISMKKHVQIKHLEKWDGYCCLCKVIVTPQGEHSFKDCLQHFIDKHSDNFPLLEKVTTALREKQTLDTALAPAEGRSSPKTYINVRPLADLISKESPEAVVEAPREECLIPFPKIENVVSLGFPTVEPPLPSPSYPSTATKETQPEKIFKYEEIQAEVMSKKHRVVLDTMMAKDKLVKVFKCAGRFCSFTSDSAEDALLHASTHQRVGGENALSCSYCDFDASKNAIDLVMHVFKMHSRCQYSCSQCFYRAAASQLVGAHYTRAHGGVPGMGSVLRTSVAVTTTIVEDSANLLSREDAVPYYVCNHDDAKCKFRTYTQGKFFEHLMQKHQNAGPHPCSLCSVTTSSPEELINHMKSHGLRLYQCTWCVHGANSEQELLDHTSAQHPTKQPQAYLRIITNKDGSPELRVLPLAYLNKTKVPIEDVTPCNAKENPVREAERSIELEKLIGHTTMMIESAGLLNLGSNAAVTDDQAQDITGDIASSSCFEPNTKNPEPELNDVMPVLETFLEAQSSNVALDQDISRCIAPVLKTETVEQTTPKDNVLKDDVIYCLDSDEEDSRQDVFHLSHDNLSNSNSQNLASPVYEKISLQFLYKCPVADCKSLYKTMSGFKKHMSVCGANNTGSFTCPHNPCTTVVSSVPDIIQHYTTDHLQVSLQTSISHKTSSNKFLCEICNTSYSSLASAKKHAKNKHCVQKLNVTSKKGTDGEIQFTVRESFKEKQLRRKRSLDTVKRYGPQDIDQLPINPILDSSVHCALCEFNTKVRLNMVRHLQLHNERQSVPQTAPVNPVPHLETNEKHFDKMVNLASSSVVTRAPDKQSRSESNPIVSLLIRPEVASRYPKYVPERQRYTCGAKGCTYISVDEGMFKRHWDTLHSGTNDYRCVHCPPNQHVDTSQPLSAARIIAHLKMHGITLYGCSNCSYYHCKKEILEKHVTLTHKGGEVQVVREERNAQTAPSTSQAVAPTMDLKPWQCGLCKFKSMLRPEVIEHCARLHQSKMPYKCAYCPFRASAIENITKHQTNSHPGKPEEVFYYYYREGSIADDADGTPRWQKQRQKSGNPEPEVKTEISDNSSTQAITTPVAIDLNLVKKEVNEVEASTFEMSEEELCRKFGQFCEPNGLKYKCSLCKVVMEQDRDVMQSHLYEELKYRKWGCRICSYKAFHRTGLNEHMASEHSRQYQEPIELPVDINIEKWVAKLLDYQAAIIDKHQNNLSKQKIQVTKAVAGPSSQKTPEVIKPSEVLDKHVAYTLEEAFGKFGTPVNMQYCCPKCNFKVKDDDSMKDHLESELTKIRWCCTKCSDNFQTYHEAQFHCKTVHPGQAAQPKEAIRDPLVRNSWITNVIQTQKNNMKSIPVSSEPATPEKAYQSDSENSLLVVRYEERVATPEVISASRKRPAPDSDEERLVIDEPENSKKKNDPMKCSYCDFVAKNRQVFRYHMYKHYNLKPFTCMYCEFIGQRLSVMHHIGKDHVGLPVRVKDTELPTVTPSEFNNMRSNKKLAVEDDAAKTICLSCEKYVPENEIEFHVHDKIKPEFARKGDVVVKCCLCLVLKMDVESLQEHHYACHPDIAINYAYFKLHYDTRGINYCGHCNKRFKFIRDLKTHHNVMHSSLEFSYTSSPYSTALNSSITDEETDSGTKRKASESNLPPMKRFARKSTTKLPFKSVAKKSTTKLPFTESDFENKTDTEYSFYGTQPSLDQYAEVTMLMPMCNTLVPINIKKLSEIIKINPKVLVKDIKKNANLED